MTWEIFCIRIDNYGDVGITWRLAQQLANEYNLVIRLWVDDLHALRKICSQVNPALKQQYINNVNVFFWPIQWIPTKPADVVIEAFGCQLPTEHITCMSEDKRPILWLNLEYLSAEHWIEEFHALPSLQSSNMNKFFFFPGFSQNTGGLIKERALIKTRTHFQQSRKKEAFLETLGLTISPDTQIISVFCYSYSNIGSWLSELSKSNHPIQLIVFDGVIVKDIALWLEKPIRNSQQIGSLNIRILPFLTHNQYDQLLWCCDFNIVRGEDSFTRALWAGKPFLWHIYPQENNAHLKKLNAFIDYYLQDSSENIQKKIQTLWLAWNNNSNLVNAWAEQTQYIDLLSTHAEKWCKKQAKKKDLASTLVQFHQNWLS